MNRGQLPARLLPTHPRGDGPERLSGRNTICRSTPSNIMSPTRSHTGPSADVSLGVRGHTKHHNALTHHHIQTGFHRHPCRRATPSRKQPPTPEGLDNNPPGQVSSRPGPR